MKHSALALALLLPSFARADLNYQINSIVGDWHCALAKPSDRDPARAFYRIQKFSDTEVKVLSCEWDEQYRHGPGRFCSYYRVDMKAFDSSFNGFCREGAEYCASGFRVSAYDSDDMVEIIDPLYRHGYNNSGKIVYQCTRAK